MTKEEIVWNCLKKHKVLTSLEIIQLVWTTCPHGLIRNLRERHKDYKILDNWITKTKTVMVNGKEKKISQRFKKYWLEVA